MGWDFGWKSKADLVNELLTASSYTIKGKAVTGGGYGETRLWVAFERPDSKRFVALFLIERSRGVWGYKAIDESMGPVALDCPLPVLNSAGPDSEALGNWSKEWRAKVRAYWMARVA